MVQQKPIPDRILIGELQARLEFAESRCLRLAAAATELDEELSATRKLLEEAKAETLAERQVLQNVSKVRDEFATRLAELDAPAIGKTKKKQAAGQSEENKWL